MIKRYDVHGAIVNFKPIMETEQCEDGGWCRYEDVAALEAENAALRNALQAINCIGEKYEEKPYGMVKFTPSLESVKRFAGEVLQETNIGASLLAELEALRGVVIAAEELYYMATNIGDFRNGNSYNGIDEGEVMARKVFAKFETSLTAAKGGS